MTKMSRKYEGQRARTRPPRLPRSALIAVLMSGATAAGAADKTLDLKAECERVFHVYPLLMLAARRGLRA